MAKRRYKGTGGVRKRKNGTYECAYNIYRKDGTAIRKSFTRKNLIEIEDLKARLHVLEPLDNDIIDIKINRYTNNISVIRIDGTTDNTNKNISLEEYLQKYLYEHRKKGINGRKIEDTTFSSYVDLATIVKKCIGTIKMKDLTFSDVEDFITDVNENYSDSTAKKVKNFIVNMIHFAKEDNVIKDDFLIGKALNLKLQKGKKEKKIIKEADIRPFIIYCKEKKYYYLILLLFTRITWKRIMWIMLECN